MNNTEQRFILSLDQGTTSSRAIIFNHSGQIKGSAQQEFTQYYPEPGWVEHDPEEIWSTQLCVARQAILNAGIGPESIESIGITNQRETVVVWDKDSGRPVYNAIVSYMRRVA
jgi:glycerol kinase